MFSTTFTALRYRDFRLFWIALTISLLGTSFQTVAQGWLIYRITGSAIMLGLTGFIPAVLAVPASIAGGIIADRFSRQKVVIVTQSLMIVPPMAIALLIWSNQILPWHVILATAVLALIAAIDFPCRTAMVPQLVPHDDLLNAQGLAQAVGQLARIVGPAIAGVAISLWGEAVPYFVNGVSYLAMVGALLMMSPLPAAVIDRTRKHSAGLLGGIQYTLKTPVIFGLLAIAAAQGLFLSSYTTLLPVFANDVLKTGAEGLGWLNAAAGIGALIGALAITSLPKGRRGAILSAGSLLTPLVMAGFALSTHLGLSLALLFFVGLGTVIIRTVTATFIMILVPDQMLGRVISLSTIIYFGAPYAAGLPLGYLTEHWGAPMVLNLAGGLFILTMLAVNIFIPAIRKQE